MRIITTFVVLATFVVATLASTGSSASSAVAPSATPSSRQTGLGTGLAGVLGAVGSMLPSVVSNLAPLVLLFGLGALMVPALGLGLLLREGRRQDQPIYYYRSFPSFNINTQGLIEGAADIFEKVIKALDNVDRKYK